ncbi:TonB-dependent receptor [Sphingobacterium sp. SRCM116780]|uniref:TonB-dependent receptor n=1 Tax=Sphingobacterium sp. SRCM116780 TaxID=2907623 RepID=UPI001F379ED2|nr:TonB-dependent receptor [Sphingobacterium sp. SRCM116780]UIR56238.1 TonB-dependent receptor [Sphingobacterium sp. SRCM116780]
MKASLPNKNNYISMKNINLLILFMMTNIYAQAQHKLVGQVTNKEGGSISGATISIENSEIATVSDSIGQFVIPNVGKQKLNLLITAIGYQTLKKTVFTTDSTLLFKLLADNLHLNEVVVSATRYGVNKKEAPVIVQVLGPKLFQATQSVAMSETLNYQPGVRVENNCQNCGFSQVRLNGLEGAYSQILINSRSVFSALNSVYGLDQLPTSMIDRIEVVRSGGSALFGANAIAGTINIITKDPVENDWQIKSTNSLIGGQSWDNTIDFNTSFVDEDLITGVTFYGMHRDRQPYDKNDDGFSEITQLKNTTFGSKAFFKPSEFNKITLDLSTIHEFRRGGDQFTKSPHFTAITEQLETSSLIGGLTYDHYLANYKQKISVYASGQKTTRKSFYGGLGDAPTTTDSLRAANSYGDTDDVSFVTGTQYTNSFDEDVFTGGIEFNYNNTNDQIPGYQRIIDQKTKGIGTYAQYEWKPLASFKALIGMRYDYIFVDGSYQLQQTERNSQKNFGSWNPRLTILYDIHDNIQFRGGYARGFRAPQAFNEDMHVTSIGGKQVFVLIGEHLKTEYSNAYTGSFNFNRNFGNTQTSLLVEGFYTQLNNPFTTVLTSESNDIMIEEMRNGTDAYVYGTNLELNIAPSRVFTLQTGGTIQQSQFKSPQLIAEAKTGQEAILSKDFLRTPNVYGYLNANWKATQKFTVDLTGVYTGKMMISHIQQQIMSLKKTTDFIELNARLGYTFAIHKDFNLEIFAGVQNMFNAFQKDFDTGANRDSNYIYGPTKPRTLTFGIKIGHFH